MAVYLAAAGDFLSRSTGLIPLSSNRTVMFWARQGTIPTGGNYNVGYGALNAVPGSDTAYLSLFHNDTPLDALNCNNGVTQNQTSAASLSADFWNHFACAYNTSTNLSTLWRNGQVIGTFTVDMDAVTVVTDILGGSVDTLGDYTVGYCRMWNAVLTTTEVRNELLSATAVKTASLWLDTPLIADLLDISGNGRTWTSNGSTSFVPGPGFLTTTNLTYQTATALPTVPFTFTQTIPTDYPTTGFIATVIPAMWFTYTVPPDTVITGLWTYSAFGDDFVGSTSVFTAANVPTSSFQTADQVPLELVGAAGDVLYIKVINAGTYNFIESLLTIEGVQEPLQAVVPGDLVINDDTGGFPVGVFDPITGTPKRFFAPYAAGESGDILADGTVLAEDILDDTIKWYDSNFTQLTSIDYPEAKYIRRTTAGDAWYVSAGNGVGIIVQRVSADGTLGDTWAIPNAARIAPSPDESTLYYADSVVGAAVKAWDLDANSALPDLVAGVGGLSICDLLTLADGSLLVGYRQAATGTSTTNYVKHYDATGATLHTYTLTSTDPLNHIAIGLEATTTFWTWEYLDTAGPLPGFARFTEFQISDGAILNEFEVVEFEFGLYKGPITDTPVARFQHSFSCPFWVQRQGVEPPSPTPGGLEADPREIRWLRQTPVLSNENTRMIHRSLTLDIESGVGLKEGQGSDPLVMLQMSNDSGHTWHNLHPATIGKRGEWAWRVMWLRLGQSRNRLYRFYGSDPVKIALVDCYTEIERGDGS